MNSTEALFEVRCAEKNFITYDYLLPVFTKNFSFYSRYNFNKYGWKDMIEELIRGWKSMKHGKLCYYNKQ